MTDTSNASVAETTLAELIRDRPGLASVFDGLGLDFCCHGDRTLTEACGIAGVDNDVVLEAMAKTGPVEAGEGWADLGPAELSEHIEAVHHNWLYTELPELAALAAKVDAVHGERHPELSEVRRLVGELQADFVPHLFKEERVLFPAIRALAEGYSEFGFGSVANPIAVMAAEHESVGALLEQLRAASDGYRAPGDGCASYQLLYQRLEAVEVDTHLHVFKENSLLFPAAVALEAELAKAVGGQPG